MPVRQVLGTLPRGVKAAGLDQRQAELQSSCHYPRESSGSGGPYRVFPY